MSEGNFSFWASVEDFDAKGLSQLRQKLRKAEAL